MIKTARDWILKRLLKFLLKRSLGKYLRTELDLEQLDVKLDSGFVELKNVLLDCEALNADLVSSHCTLGCKNTDLGYV
jgi:hypothetical protein